MCKRTTQILCIMVQSKNITSGSCIIYQHHFHRGVFIVHGLVLRFDGILPEKGSDINCLYIGKDALLLRGSIITPCTKMAIFFGAHIEVFLITMIILCYADNLRLVSLNHICSFCNLAMVVQENCSLFQIMERTNMEHLEV